MKLRTGKVSPPRRFVRTGGGGRSLRFPPPTALKRLFKSLPWVCSKKFCSLSSSFLSLSLFTYIIPIIGGLVLLTFLLNWTLKRYLNRKYPTREFQWPTDLGSVDNSSARYKIFLKELSGRADMVSLEKKMGRILSKVPRASLRYRTSFLGVHSLEPFESSLGDDVGHVDPSQFISEYQSQRLITKQTLHVAVNEILNGADLGGQLWHVTVIPIMGSAADSFSCPNHALLLRVSPLVGMRELREILSVLNVSSSVFYLSTKRKTIEIKERLWSYIVSGPAEEPIELLREMCSNLFRSLVRLFALMRVATEMFIEVVCLPLLTMAHEASADLPGLTAGTNDDQMTVAWSEDITSDSAVYSAAFSEEDNEDIILELIGKSIRNHLLTISRSVPAALRSLVSHETVEINKDDRGDKSTRKMCTRLRKTIQLISHLKDQSVNNRDRRQRDHDEDLIISSLSRCLKFALPPVAFHWIARWIALIHPVNINILHVKTHEGPPGDQIRYWQLLNGSTRIQVTILRYPTVTRIGFAAKRKFLQSAAHLAHCFNTQVLEYGYESRTLN